MVIINISNRTKHIFSWWVTKVHERMDWIVTSKTQLKREIWNGASQQILHKARN